MRKLILFLLIIISMSNCNKNNCNQIDNIELSDFLLRKANDYDYDYCLLVNKSLSKDSKSIIELSLLKFYSGAIYEHGATIISIIDIVGVDFYIGSIKSLSSQEKRFIYNYILAGLDYIKNPKYKNKYIDDLFPELVKVLKSTP